MGEASSGVSEKATRASPQVGFFLYLGHSTEEAFPCDSVINYPLLLPKFDEHMSDSAIHSIAGAAGGIVAMTAT